MAQMHGKPSGFNMDNQAAKKFQRSKLAHEGILTSSRGVAQQFVEAVRHASLFISESNGTLSPAVAKAAMIASYMDNKSFREAALKFSDTPSVLAFLSVCALLPYNAAAKEYQKRHLDSQNPMLSNRAAISIVEGFFNSGVLLPALQKRLEARHLGSTTPLHQIHELLSERLAALRRSAFVALKDMYELTPEQFETVKIEAGAFFAVKFEDFYRCNRGWTWIYDRR